MENKYKLYEDVSDIRTCISWISFHYENYFGIKPEIWDDELLDDNEALHVSIFDKGYKTFSFRNDGKVVVVRHGIKKRVILYTRTYKNLGKMLRKELRLE